MRTFKYTYVDAKGNPKESTVEADDKNDAYIILKTMRINPDSITETESEDISFEVIGEKEPEKEEHLRPIVRTPSPRTGPMTRTADELTIEMLSPIGDVKPAEDEPKKKNGYLPPYEMFGIFWPGFALVGG